MKINIPSSEGNELVTFLPEFNESLSELFPEDSTDFALLSLETSVGLILAISSCFFIGVSVIYKKLALKDLQEKGETRAVDGGYGYLKSRKWWFGITLMGLGELTNFVAYIFAPAILVTPLGVFSIVCTAALSPYFLKERLNAIGKVGCILVLVGCVMVTLCGPKDREVGTMEELQQQLLNIGFLTYACIVVGVSIILMGLVPRYGHKYVMLYITICSSFGSLSVMFCKGVGLALKQTFTGTNEFVKWPTWVCLVSLVGCLLIETVFMQRALDIFNSSVFMSINYVMFTSLVIIASSILYTELRELGWKNIILTILGFIVNIAALYMLHLDKEASGNTANDDLTAVNSPDENPATPLMINNNDRKSSFSDLLKKEVEKSPLSNLKFSPNILSDGMMSKRVLSFISKDSNNSERSDSLDSCPHILSKDTDVREAVSNLSAEDKNKNLDVVTEKCKVVTQCMCEVPIITELQSSALSRGDRLDKP